MSITPGPWMARQKYTGISVFDSNGDGVANVCQSYGDTPYKVWTNARLIAAAPEMVKLLYKAHEELTDILEYNDLYLDEEKSAADIGREIEVLLRRVNGKEEAQ